MKYLTPEGTLKATDFLYISILAVLLTHNFYIKTILLTNNFYGKKLFAFASIYSLTSKMCCNFWGVATCFLLK